MIGDGEATPHGARVVVGPGTGLGAGALIHSRGRWVPIPGEGGHVDLGPVSPRDFEIARDEGWYRIPARHARR